MINPAIASPRTRFSGTVHRTEEIGRIGKLFPTADSLLLVNQSGGQVSINSCLFPRRGVEGKRAATSLIRVAPFVSTTN